MRTQLHIVAGSLRGRKITYEVDASLRPTPQRVREALFSILGNAIPDRLFVDVFGGTGLVGLEALRRGALTVYLLERDLRLARGIEENVQRFKLTRQARLYRTDAYRWMASWEPPPEPVN